MDGISLQFMTVVLFLQTCRHGPISSDGPWEATTQCIPYLLAPGFSFYTYIIFVFGLGIWIVDFGLACLFSWFFLFVASGMGSDEL